MTSGLQVELDDGPKRPVPLAGTAPTAPPSDFGTERFLNREASWVEFANRVLDLAADSRQPLLERVKFLAISASGADEFFQVRVAGLKDQLAAGIRSRSPDGRNARDQLGLVHEHVTTFVARQAAIFSELQRELAVQGICLLDYARLEDEAKDELRRAFERDIYPVLTPLAVDPGHPFPYISNLSLNLAVLVDDPVTNERRFARVKVPPLLPRFIPLSDKQRFVPLEQVIAANLSQLFPEMHVGSHHAFRVTRNADLELEEEGADDLLEAVELELRRRRFGRAVRLEIDPDVDREVLDLLLRELELEPEDVYGAAAPIDLGELWSFTKLDRPDLMAPPWTPIVPPELAGGDEQHGDIFSVIRERDVLVQHPYDSFAGSVETFISRAAADPDVLAIKMTLYRTSGDAPFVSALARANEAGKQVAALVELKARFDEQRNIVWARQLEQSGVHVVYGVVGLKTHSKTALVVRREDDGIRRYCHIGTGNYNSDTARVYEDLGLLTADADLGADLTNLFNHLTGFSRPTRSRSLILAPERFREWFHEELAVEHALGPAGRVVLKCNGLTDPEVIDALYAASQAGVRIELIVRSICSLRPGVPGLSETITVRSIVGRYLEHSRIYRFGEPGPQVRTLQAWPSRGDGEQGDAHLDEAAAGVPQDHGHDPELPTNGVTVRDDAVAADEATSISPARYVIGSGDLMERNLDRRIEALVPVRDPALQARLEDVLDLALADDEQTWQLSPEGTWHRIDSRRHISLQQRLEDLTLARSRRRRASEHTL